MKIFTDKLIPEATKLTADRYTKYHRIPQSIMLTGGTEALQTKCAYELASAVLCSQPDAPCGKCPACKKALAQVHPDITVIKPTENRKLVSIDDIRTGVIERLYITPNEAENKVFILTDASDYSVFIQNALLKTIEEPPQDCMFILLCNQRSDMLTTIVSRATELYLGEPPEGKPKKKDSTSDDIAAAVAKAFANGNEYAMMEASAAIGRERELLAKSVSRLILIIRDALTEGSGADIMGGHEDISRIFSDNYSPVALVKIKQLLDDVAYRSDINCNVALTTAYLTSEAGILIKEYYKK